MLIELTKSANDRLSQLFSKDENKNKVIRLFIKSYGWCGAKIGIVLEELENINPKEINLINGYRFIVDKDLSNTYRMLNIDYSHKWYKKGFHFEARFE